VFIDETEELLLNVGMVSFKLFDSLFTKLFLLRVEFEFLEFVEIVFTGLVSVEFKPRALFTELKNDILFNAYIFLNEPSSCAFSQPSVQLTQQCLKVS